MLFIYLKRNFSSIFQKRFKRAVIILNKNTTYKDLCDSVFPKIKDYGFAGIDEDEAYDIIQDYLKPAILMFSGCNQDLDDRDDLLKTFNFQLTSRNFEILSNYMVICYLDSNFIRTGEMLQAHISSTAFHKYDNKDVLGKVKEVREMYKKENDQLMINLSYPQSPIFNSVLKRGR